MLGLLNRRKMLTERQEALLERERRALSDLRAALATFGADVTPGDTRTLDDIIAHLDELFLLVIAGEFNSGKSSFINALVGDDVLREGVTPTTDRITLLRHGAQAGEHRVEEFLIEYSFPADVLQHVVIVDTPGTNAIIRRHEELTREFIPRADLVLFVTSADRPFTESERQFLSAIQQWGKKIIVVLNKVDLLSGAEAEQVVAFIRDNARTLLGFTPEVFPVSARLAKRARAAAGDPEAWASSRFDAIERYIVETLDEEQRVRLKLLSPLGVAQRLTDKYLQVVESRLGTLQQDFGTIDNIERQLELFRTDLATDFRYHQTEIEKLLNDFERRGLDFLDQNIAVTNILELRNTRRLGERFEREVVGDVQQQIDARLHALIDWMIEHNLRLWQSIMDYVQRNRVPEHREGLIGDVGGSFEYNRSALIGSVAASAQRVVKGYDRDAEALSLIENVRGALTATAIAEVGAVGLGAVLVALLHGAVLDLTGILAAVSVGVVGLYVIPAKRRQLKKDFREKVNTLRTQLPETMRREFERELDLMMTRIREAIAPYTRFIRSQREQLAAVQTALSDVDVDLGKLKAEIDK